jgi:GTP pyrophosphokinase
VAPGESGWFGLAKAANLVFRVPGKGENGEPLPLRGVDWDAPVRFAPKGGAVPGERIVGIRTPGEGITIYPIHSPALVAYDDKPELWLDVRWDLDAANKALYPTQLQVTTLNEPGALGVVATTIGENGANIDNVAFNPSGSDFRELRFDLQVFDIQHLNTIVAQLRDKPVVAKVERLSR